MHNKDSKGKILENVTGYRLHLSCKECNIRNNGEIHFKIGSSRDIKNSSNEIGVCCKMVFYHVG